MIETLKIAKGYLNYLTSLEPPFEKDYAEELDQAQMRVRKLLDVFALKLDVVVPALCYFWNYSFAYRKDMIIDQISFSFPDENLEEQKFVYLYLVSLKDQELVKQSLLQRSSHVLPGSCLEEVFAYFSEILGVLGITIYSRDHKPNYLCLPGHYDMLEELPNKAVFMSSNPKLLAFVGQILEGRFQEVVPSLSDSYKYVDVHDVEKSLPDFYRKSMIRMPEE